MVVQVGWKGPIWHLNSMITFLMFINGELCVEEVFHSIHW